jgi:predicted nucleotidyltransferase
VTGPAESASFVAALRDLVRWLDGEGFPAAVIGGVAASTHGRPRMTRDVDLLALVAKGSWQGFIDKSGEYGFEPRRADAVEFAHRTRVVLLRHRATAIDLDVTLAGLPFEREVVERAARMPVGGVEVPLATAEDLVILKAVARRPRDLADIEGILDSQPDLDLDRIRQWVREFSAALDRPEVFEELVELLRRLRR